ncbi:hypothetical protein CFK39_14230 [Brachybacterium avium]|uniref:Uncharacterized protein n=2 Tax=Brachybacterium avium TaxID=2017485 RepID=A0A220UHQ9_9MICO|nr:hypothetical protein CFK39_14230 [Brachybacterium avium]
MNTFWGCETEHLTELSTIFDTRAVRLRALIQRALLCARAADWIGPDAEEHHRCTEDLAETVILLVEKLRKLGELLGKEAQEQDLCSQPDDVTRLGGDPLGVRATPPWVQDEFDRLPSLQGSRWKDLQPRIAGPFMAEDPTELLPDLPSFDELDPVIAGPIMAEDPPWATPPSRPLPEGEDFALDPEILAAAQDRRELALGEVPAVGTAQTLMSVHESIGDGFDRVELKLEDNGYGAFVPAVSLARLPHEVSGAVLGEHSVLDQTFSAIDRGVANVTQTSDEVLTAAGDGDAAGAFRAFERGAFRQVGVSADLLTVSALPAAADTTSDLIGTSADLVEPFNAHSAEALRTAEQSVREVGLGWERGQEQLTDPEFYYDLRRRYLPAPWDPQG